MDDFIIVNGELYHHGVKGMKWGVRKKQYVTARQGIRNANNAAKEARKKSIAESRATDSGIGSYRRAMKKASAAGQKAYKDSIAADKAHNKEARAKKKAAEDLKKYSKKLKTGSSLSIVALALENQGMKKLSDIMYKKSDARYEKWEAKAAEAKRKLGQKTVTELKVAD